MSYRIFTIHSGKVADGAAVERLKLSGAGVEIDAIIIGEEGRGRSRGVLPVQGAPIQGPPDEWGRRPERLIFAADIGLTKSGKPKLVVGQTTTSDKAIVVFRTPIGFRGGNSHTGDQRPEWDAWEKTSQAAFAACQVAVASDGRDEYGRASPCFLCPRGVGAGESRPGEVFFPSPARSSPRVQSPKVMPDAPAAAIRSSP